MPITSNTLDEDIYSGIFNNIYFPYLPGMKKTLFLLP